MSNTTSLFHKMINEYALLGIDKLEKNLHHITGHEIPLWVKEGPIYEIFVRTFSKEGTFNEVENQLNYLKDLGIKTIWLMPIHPIGEKGRKGKLGSPYAIKDYFKINEEYGTEEDLKHLINSAHQKNMCMILDLVANHTALDHVELKNNPGMFLKDSAGNIIRKRPEWSDVMDLDYKNKKTWDYMKSVMRYWIKEFNFDGFRCDVAGLVPIEFWNETVNELKRIKSDIFMLAEWESPDMHVNAFHSTYDWSLYFLLKDICKGKKPASMALDWILEKQKFYPKNSLPLRFLENHDFDRSVKVFGEEAIDPFTSFIFSIYGIPLIYAGQEIGEDKKPSHFEKGEIDWFNKDKKIFKFYKNLIGLRNNNPALSSKEIILLKNNQSEHILTYIKKDSKNEIGVIINFSGNSLPIRIEQPEHFQNTDYFDLLQNEKINSRELASGGLKINAFQSMFLKKDQS